MITNKKGFTLLELLVYTVGLVLILTAIIYLIYQIYGFYDILTAGPRADKIGLALSDRLAKDIRTGVSIDTAQSTFGVPTGTLTINAKLNDTDIVKRFVSQGGRVTYAENGGTASPLSPPDIAISKLQFTQLSNGISEAIRYEIEITFQTRRGSETRHYDGLAILRQSYE